MAQSADGDGMTVYWGDRLDRLAQMFADNLEAAPSRDPFQAETIVVGSRVTAGWLRQFFLYDRRGGRQRVVANWDVQFLHVFINDWLHRISAHNEHDPDVKRDPLKHPYAPGVMQWRLFRLLQGDLLADPACDTLRGYLGDDPTPARRFELAGVVARLFDEYQVYRPRMLDDWQQGRPTPGVDLRDLRWQPRLWRALTADNPGSYLRQFLGLRPDMAAHPEIRNLRRVSVFGVSAMPVVYIAFFRELSRHVPVNLYVFNPSREHWLDQVTTRQRDSELIRLQGDVDAEDLYLEEGNPLLVALGRSNQHYLNELLEVAEAPDLLGDGFSPDRHDSLLHILQADIRNDAPVATPTEPPSTADASLRIAICHGPQREVEVLHDQLLACFAADPALQPRDIQVQLADMATYMPYIDAVFGTINSRGDRSIPYVVADRFVASESQVARAFCTLLNLPTSRFAASEVLDLLESEGVGLAFDFSAEDVALVRNWVRDSAIRWGLDRDHRLARSQADFEPTATWEQGLHRLMLGYALGRGERGRSSQLWDAGELGLLLPFDAAEGDAAPLIGRLARFVHELRQALRIMAGSRTPGDWATELLALVERFFAQTNENYNDVATIRRTVANLPALTAIADMQDTEVAGDVVARYLQQQISQAESQDSLTHNAMVVTALRPMSSTPRRIQCLLGMSDGVYPRQDMRTQFDLIARQPHRGDPLRRWQDRQAVLEALMSAGDQFYMSYLGRTVDGNELLPPSTIVTEIRDYLEGRFDWQESSAQTAWDGSTLLPFETLHHLQAFHTDYFDGQHDLWSYSRENRDAAAAMLADPSDAPPPAPPTILTPVPRELSLRELIAFFRNPAQAYYQQTLRVRFDAETFALVEDQEPFELQGLAGYATSQAVLASLLRQTDTAASPASQRMLYEQLKQQGLVPLGEPGWSMFQALCQEVERYVATPLDDAGGATLRELAARPRRRVTVRSDRGARDVEGPVELVDGDNSSLVLHYRYAETKPKDWLQGWLEHVLVATTGAASRTLILGAKKGQPMVQTYAPLPPDRAQEILATFLDLHASWRRQAMPFTPATSYAWWRSWQKDGDPIAAMEAARGAWVPSSRGRQDGEDPYFSRAFGADGPMTLAPDTFVQIAERVFADLTLAAEEGDE